MRVPRRGCIDENLYLRFRAAQLHDELRQMLEHALDDVVIVSVAGIDGNIAAFGIGRRSFGWRIGQAE